jgi:arylsulfatase A
MRRSTRTLWSVLLGLCLLSAFALAAGSSAARTKPPRPLNVVLILADDLGWGDVGFNGRTTWKTPNLDRLARQGTVFTRWYTNAVVCAPSRAALMTGRYGIHNGVSANNQDLPRSEVTLAEALKANGYATALFGKWHHGVTRPGETTYVHPMDQGFDEFFGFTDAGHAWQKFPKELWQGRELKPFAGDANRAFTEHSFDFIHRNREKPFFLYVPYTDTHFYVDAGPEDLKLYNGKFKEKDPSKPYNAHYAATVHRLDEQVGRLMKTLDDEGVRDNTLVLFTSDHGATFEVGNQGTSAFHDSNHPFRGQKRTLWEGGIRVPGIVRWPGVVPSGRSVDQPVAMIDLFPTILTAAGLTPPNTNLDGTNLLPLWKGEAPLPDRTLFWEWRSEGYQQLAAMRGDMKLVQSPGAPAELFNVVNDPAERRTLAQELPNTAKALSAQLKRWLDTEIEAARFGRPAPMPAR